MTTGQGWPTHPTCIPDPECFDQNISALVGSYYERGLGGLEVYTHAVLRDV